MGKNRLFCVGVHPQDPLLLALRNWHPGVQPLTLGTGLTPKDRLLVLVEAAPNRASCQGLKMLDEILANPGHDPGAVAVVSFQSQTALLKRAELHPEVGSLAISPADAIPYVSGRLPLSCAELTELVNTDQPRDWRWWLLRLEASCRLLQIEGARYRHDHKNLLAAVRIFLGTLQAGHTDLSYPNDATEVLDQLRNLDVTARTPDPDQMVARCAAHRELVAMVKKSSPPKPPFDPAWRSRLEMLGRHTAISPGSTVKTAVFMLDDQYHSRGWSLVLPRVARVVTGRDHWTFKDEVQERVFLDSVAQKSDLMLLDCNLGAGSPTGLELLPRLRSLSLDLPIVMMTAFDHAELALWAMRAGCNGFYAKELQDRKNRAPLDYFLSLREVLKRQPWEQELRELWQKFEVKLPAEKSDDEGDLRVAFYMLFSAADGATGWIRASSSSKSMGDWPFRAAALSAGALLQRHSHELDRRIHSLLVQARHHSVRQNGVFTARNALEVLRAAVARFEGAGHQVKRTATAAMPPGCGLRRELLQADDLSWLASPRDPAGHLLGHLQRSGLGAFQLVLGKVGSDILDSICSFGATDNPFARIDLLRPHVHAPEMTVDAPRIVLIDDDFVGNGWLEALRLVFGPSVVAFDSLDSFLSNSQATDSCLSADVLLLDLWLVDTPGATPSPEVGIKALQRLRSADPGLPILMLSAATDSLQAIRCMKLGAVDFLPKWLPNHSSRGDWSEFTASFVNRVTAAARVGCSELRRMWAQLSRLAVSKDQLAQTLSAQFVADWGGPTAESVGADLCGRYYELVVASLLLYHRYRVTALTQDVFPALDQWRIDGVLRSTENLAYDVVALAGRASEYLGWTRCCIEQNRRVPEFDWSQICSQGNTPSAQEFVARASRSALKAWNLRNEIFHAQEKATSPTARDAMQCILDAWEEFVKGIGFQDMGTEVHTLASLKIPPGATGLLVGSKGTNVRDIMRKSGATIQINRDVIEITGAKENRRKALTELQKLAATVRQTSTKSRGRPKLTAKPRRHEWEDDEDY